MAAAIPAPIPNDGPCINRVNKIQSHLVVCVINKIQNSKIHLIDILMASGFGKFFPPWSPAQYVKIFTRIQEPKKIKNILKCEM